MIFGIITELDATTGVVVFVCTLFSLAFLERSFDSIQEWATLNQHEILFGKLQKELLHLGILSFFLFFLKAADAIKGLQYFEAFEFTHVVMLFIAFAFIAQAFFLIQYVHDAKKLYLVSVRQSIDTILDRHEKYRESCSPLWKKLLRLTPTWASFSPQIKLDLEFKLLEKVFMQEHQLHPQFNFAKYVGHLFKQYIADLGEVSTSSWIILAVLATINYIRILCNNFNIAGANRDCHHAGTAAYMALNNSIATTSHHSTLPFTGNISSFSGSTTSAADTSTLLHANATNSSTELCDELMLQYAITCAMLATAYIIAVLVAACIYHHNMLVTALAKQGINWKAEIRAGGYDGVLRQINDGEEGTDRGGNNSYEKYRTPTTGTVTSLSTISSKRTRSSTSQSESPGTMSLASIFSGKRRTASAPSQSPSDIDPGASASSSSSSSSPTSTPSSPTAESRRGYYPDFALNVTQKQRAEEVRREHRKESVDSRVQVVHDIFIAKTETESIVNWTDMRDIFVLQRPGWFFVCVKFSMFLQCVYISLCCTQLLPVALLVPKRGVWVAGFSLLIVINFYLLRQVIHKAVQILSVLHLDPKLLSKVCEESLTEQQILTTLGVRIRLFLETKNVDYSFWQIALHEAFDVYAQGLIPRESHEQPPVRYQTKSGFHHFLTYVGVYLSHREFVILWERADEDLTGTITWQQVATIVFPGSISLDPDNTTAPLAQLIGSIRTAILSWSPTAGVRETADSTAVRIEIPAPEPMAMQRNIMKQASRYNGGETEMTAIGVHTASIQLMFTRCNRANAAPGCLSVGDFEWMLQQELGLRARGAVLLQLIEMIQQHDTRAEQQATHRLNGDFAPSRSDNINKTDKTNNADKTDKTDLANGSKKLIKIEDFEQIIFPGPGVEEGGDPSGRELQAERRHGRIQQGDRSSAAPTAGLPSPTASRAAVLPDGVSSNTSDSEQDECRCSVCSTWQWV